VTQAYDPSFEEDNLCHYLQLKYLSANKVYKRSAEEKKTVHLLLKRKR
jgi:hypothetical protein